MLPHNTQPSPRGQHPPSTQPNPAHGNDLAAPIDNGHAAMGREEPATASQLDAAGRVDRCRMWLTCGTADPRVRIRPFIDDLLAQGFRRGDGSERHLVLWNSGATIWMRYVPVSERDRSASIIVDVWGFDVGVSLASFIARELVDNPAADLRIDLQSKTGLRTVSLTNGLDLEPAGLSQGQPS